MTGPNSKDLAEPMGTEGGFTLLETLIAFLVLSMSLGVFVLSVSQAAMQSRSAHTMLDAERVAAILLSEDISDRSQDLADEGSDEVTGLTWRRIRASTSLSGTDSSSPASLLIAIEIRSKGGSAPIFVAKTIRIVEIGQ